MQKVPKFTGINQFLVDQIQDIIQNFFAMPQEDEIGEIMYHLQEYLKLHDLQGPSVLVLSELIKGSDESVAMDVIELLIYNLTNESGRTTEPMMISCALGLRNISEHNKDLFLIILKRLMTQIVMGEGLFIGLYHLKDCIRMHCPEKAVDIVHKYEKVITSIRESIEVRKSAMELVGDMAFIAGSETVSSYITTVGTLMEETSDPTLRTACEYYLAKFVGVAGAGHPLIQRLIQQFGTDVRHRDRSVRMRILRQLKIFSSFLTNEETYSYCAILLADPHHAVREAMLKDILSGSIPALNNLADDMRLELFRIKREEAKEEHRQKDSQDDSVDDESDDKENGGDERNSGQGDGSTSAVKSHKHVMMSATDVTTSGASGHGASTAFGQESVAFEEVGVLSVPMPDNDPFNREYFGSATHKKFLNLYGLDADDPMFDIQVNQVSADKTWDRDGDWDEKGSSDRSSTSEGGNGSGAGSTGGGKSILTASSKSSAAAISKLITPGMNTAPMLHLLLKSDVRIAHGLLTEYDSEMKNLMENDQWDLETIHKLNVFSHLLIGLDGIRNDMNEYVRTLLAFISVCESRSTSMREDIFGMMETQIFMQSSLMEMPIVSADHYNAIESHRRALESASINSSTGADTMIKRKEELQQLLNRRTADLGMIVHTHIRSIQLLGAIYETSQTLNGEELVEGLRALLGMLSDDHRGVRQSVRESIIVMVQGQHRRSEKLVLDVRNSLDYLKMRLDKRGMGRKKADVMFLIAHLIQFSKGTQKSNAINKIIDCWDDSDGVVRRLGIDLIKHLCEYQEHEMQDFLVSKSGRSSLLMMQITKRVNDENYLDREHLNELLKFYFQRGQKN
eukprot:TRINITY_DN1122_c0_g1_i1.p1 TRINITY_DN1122_c0_g1~~TRINITY_DN1122_c0_g1_i1.p1  ORF type:complete len:941 (-),score=347.31 TRINITY_DN1122_c0_g1_i1:3590-6142(-)